MKQLGAKIYYCLLSGNVIKLIGDMQGYVRETSFDEDYEIYTELKERDKDSIGLLQFEYGEYYKLSRNSAGVMVNLDTKELMFSYEELPQETTSTWGEDIENKISVLEEENQTLKEELTQIQTSIASLTSLITTLEEK